MQVELNDWAALSTQTPEARCEALQKHLQPVVEAHTEEFVQDLSHISEAAIYEGNIAIDVIEHLSDDLYRCVYSYDWAIAWTCSGTQEAGRVQEKVRFMVDSDGVAHFKFLQFN